MSRVAAHSLLSAVAFGLVMLAALFLCTLGLASIFRPDRTKDFLGAFASSARTHFTEIALRVLVGLALVHTAPRMQFASLLTMFGWLLIGTSAVLALVPWRWHRRFADWSLPRATRFMALFGGVSLIGGVLMLCALLLGRGTS